MCQGCFHNSTFADLKKESPLAYRDLSYTLYGSWVSLALLSGITVTFRYLGR